MHPLAFLVASLCFSTCRAEKPKSKASATSEAADAQDLETFMSIAFVGASDSGKSETSNRMTGTAKFSVVEHASAEEELNHRHAVESGILRTKAGTKYLILDAPSFQPDKVGNEELLGQIAHKSEKGVHMFVFVLPYAWIKEASALHPKDKKHTDKHVSAFKAFKSAFGRLALQHTALVITKCEDKREDHIQEELKDLCKEKPHAKICEMMLELGLPPLVAIGDTSPKRKARDQDRMLQASKLIMQKNHWHAYDAHAFEDVRKERDELQARIDKLTSSKGKSDLQIMLNQVRAGIRDEKEIKRIMNMIEVRLKEAEQQAKRHSRLRPLRLLFYFCAISLVVGLSIPSSRQLLIQRWKDFHSDNPIDESGRKKEWNKKVLYAKVKGALITLKDPAATKAAIIGIVISLRTRIVQLLRQMASAADNCSCSREDQAERGEAAGIDVSEGSSANVDSSALSGSSMYGSLSEEVMSLLNRLWTRLVEIVNFCRGMGLTESHGLRKSSSTKHKVGILLGKSGLPELS